MISPTFLWIMHRFDHRELDTGFIRYGFVSISVELGWT
jgi:hypothetical protein